LSSSYDLHKKTDETRAIHRCPEGTLPVISDTGFISTLRRVAKAFQQLHEANERISSSSDTGQPHRSIEAVPFCKEHHITLLNLPPRASHKPLDVDFFGPLKEAYAQEADRWSVNHPGTAVVMK
jgi:hypothetical protein